MQIVLQLFNSVCFIFSRCFQKESIDNKNGVLYSVCMGVCVWCVLFVSECDAFISTREKNWYNCFDIFFFLCNCQTDDANLLSYANFTRTKETVTIFFVVIFSLLYLWFAGCTFFFLSSGCVPFKFIVSQFHRSHWMEKQRFVDVQFINGRAKIPTTEFSKCVFSFFSYWNFTVSIHTQQNERKIME